MSYHKYIATQMITNLRISASNLRDDIVGESQMPPNLLEKRVPRVIPLIYHLFPRMKYPILSSNVIVLRVEYIITVPPMDFQRTPLGTKSSKTYGLF